METTLCTKCLIASTMLLVGGVPVEARATTLHDICPTLVTNGPDAIPNIFPTDGVIHPMTREYERRYPILVFDVLTATKGIDSNEYKADSNHHYTYWKEPDTNTLIPLPDDTIIPRVYTTDKVLVVACRARFGDNSSVGSTAFSVNDYTSQEIGSNAEAKAAHIGQSPIELNRLYVLEAAKGNDIMRVALTVQKTLRGDNAHAVTDVVAIALLERHRIIFFSAGGGVLFTRATPPSFTSGSVVSTTTTTTTVTTTISSNPPTVGSTTEPSGTETNTTTASSTGTVNYAFRSQSSNWQMNGIAGVTWYPLGRDTFPITDKDGFTTSYGQYSARGSFGIFAGTSVDSLGNFTVGPAYELYPGVQILAASSWWSKPRLEKNVIACTGYGASPSFAYPPSSSETDTKTTTNSDGSVTTTTVTTSEASTAVTGCANGDKATILPGSTVPTVTDWKPAFALGVVFNTNLFKAFSGMGK